MNGDAVNREAEGNEIKALSEAEWAVERERRERVAEEAATQKLNAGHPGARHEEEGARLPTYLGLFRGKIARLSHPLREEVCRRLVREESSSKILDWLNSLPEV